MEYGTAPDKARLSVAAPPANCAHSKRATHWLQSRPHVQDSSGMPYFFSFPPISVYKERVALSLYTLIVQEDNRLCSSGCCNRLHHSHNGLIRISPGIIKLCR